MLNIEFLVDTCFFFQHFKDVILLSLASMVSDKTAVVLIFLSLYEMCPPATRAAFVFSLLLVWGNLTMISFRRVVSVYVFTLLSL